MRRPLAIVAFVAGIFAIASPASAERIGPGHHKSWGKAGVSFEDYASDAGMCGQRAANIDLAGTQPARALVLASRFMDNWKGGDAIMAVRFASLDVQWNRAATIMQRELDSCLIERGYVKFELTRGQARRLRTLEQDSEERRQYLHSLASDPEILAAQALMDT